jgi:hypothetical protein
MIWELGQDIQPFNNTNSLMRKGVSEGLKIYNTKLLLQDL